MLILKHDASKFLFREQLIELMTYEILTKRLPEQSLQFHTTVAGQYGYWCNNVQNGEVLDRLHQKLSET